MILNITDKDRFVNDFLTPISRVSESAVLDIQPGLIKTIIATNDNAIVISAQYNDKSVDLTRKLNIPDIKKFCRILSCIEEQQISFNLETNSIGYTSPTVRFKYHLYEDNIISLPKLNMDKLSKLSVDGKFSLSNIAITSLIKGSSIATETNRLYLSFKGNIVHGDLTDLTRANTDSYGMKLTDDYSGQQLDKPIPLNFEIFRIISCIKFKTITAQLIAKLGVLIFDIALESTDIRFVASALVN